MSPVRSPIAPSGRLERDVARLALSVGVRIREERVRRSWTLRELARRAGLSVAAVHAAESGRRASLATYARLADALNLRMEVLLLDPRRRLVAPTVDVDLVHAAMGDLEAARLAEFGLRVGIDEPYQHYQFAGRADLVAWDIEARTLLHIENRTRFPDIQQAAGAWNAKRTYMPVALAGRLGVTGWTSVTHVMIVLWSAEALHVLRLRTATFRAICPDPADAFAAWWSGLPPRDGTSAALVVLDPCAIGRQRLYCGLEDALRRRPRYRGYADAAQRLRGLQRLAPPQVPSFHAT